jgi:hypothetical protein
MARWITPLALTSLLIVLSLAMLGCSHSEQDVAGVWASKDVVLRISREGKNGQQYTIEWKEPNTLSRGTIGFDSSSSFRNGVLRISRENGAGDPSIGDMTLTYSRGRLFWRGQEFRRALPEEFSRTRPQ